MSHARSGLPPLNLEPFDPTPLYAAARSPRRDKHQPTHKENASPPGHRGRRHGPGRARRRRRGLPELSQAEQAGAAVSACTGRPIDGIPSDTAGFPGTAASCNAAHASPPGVRRTA